MISLSTQQSEAMQAIGHWLDDADRGDQVFRLFGHAGSGKSSLAKLLLPRGAQFVTFTGKAASVLRRKGCPNATTIHALVYQPDGEDEEGEPIFTFSPKASPDLVVLDECSMVGEQVGRDLESLGAPILVLGDPFQLPPIEGAGYFTSADPDFLLTEIHRQAGDSGVLSMATRVREGGHLEPAEWKESRVIRRGAITDDDLLGADQVLCGTNRARRHLNMEIRRRLGRMGDWPLVGDRLVCLRNAHRKGLLNGEQWIVEAVDPLDEESLFLRLRERDGDRRLHVSAWRSCFTDAPTTWKSWRERCAHNEFDFGYALTVHKGQGSQWDNVVVIDESRAFREHAARHLYTAITRASERVTVAL